MLAFSKSICLELIMNMMIRLEPITFVKLVMLNMFGRYLFLFLYFSRPGRKNSTSILILVGANNCQRNINHHSWLLALGDMSLAPPPTAMRSLHIHVHKICVNKPLATRKSPRIMEGGSSNLRIAQSRESSILTSPPKE